MCCCLLYLTAPLLFIHLHFAHDYYQYANLVFLIAAPAFVVIGMIERGGLTTYLAPLIVLAFLGSSVHFYFSYFYEIQKTNETGFAPLCDRIQQVSNPEDVIIVFGMDWTSAVAYYSKRRTLMMVNWPTNRKSPADYEKMFAGYQVAAVVFDRSGERACASYTIARHPAKLRPFANARDHIGQFRIVLGQGQRYSHQPAITSG